MVAAPVTETRNVAGAPAAAIKNPAIEGAMTRLLPKAMEMAGTIASKSPVALAYCKDSTNRALHGDIGANLVHEADLFSILFATEDAKEGLGAFTEKRTPNFVGR